PSSVVGASQQVRKRERRRPAMRTYLVLFLAAVFALSPLEGIAADKQVKDVKELAGSWRGWGGGGQGGARGTRVGSGGGKIQGLDHHWLDHRGAVLAAGRQAALSLIANDRDGEALGRQRHDHPHGGAGRPQLPYWHRPIRTGQVAAARGGARETGPLEPV